MAIDLKVVTPDNMGATLQLGLKEAGKYDVDLPAGVTGAALNDGVLSLTLTSGSPVTVDLKPMLPSIAADVFLKEVRRNANTIEFVVGKDGNTDNDTVLSVDVADLLPVTTDASLTGNGTTASPLAAAVSATVSDNLLKVTDDGLAVSATDIAAAVAQPVANTNIRLADASGQTVIGYLYSTEQGA